MGRALSDGRWQATLDGLNPESPRWLNQRIYKNIKILNTQRVQCGLIQEHTLKPIGIHSSTKPMEFPKTGVSLMYPQFLGNPYSRSPRKGPPQFLKDPIFGLSLKSGPPSSCAACYPSQARHSTSSKLWTGSPTALGQVEVSKSQEGSY